MNTDPRLEAAARGIFLAHPLSDKSMVDACWDLYENEGAAAVAAIDKAATITTEAELDALPNESVILDDAGYPYRRGQAGAGHLGEWESAELGEFLPASTIDYPARVILRGPA